ncbi:Fusaric acid resistance protein [Sphingomonas oleivorans]|uniref:Fusaric acid resistance protein n=1 Tax=Sphingomonas oleivorans TaxID=1735121 RepID=A0A2T5FXM0_9SPHN|nr:FUSC family protein [Sphingomonas oleivorans]PTQ10878.1 Fusaric acid resistance protein [Sphingomonas oleivorans]
MPAALRHGIFSLNCFAAAMLALYVSLGLGLDRPYWAMITVYITSQPLAGALRSKALYRLLGTLLGAAASLTLVPALINVPALLSLALAAWLGLCLFVALLDRTPRSYLFMLAGYSAMLIAFPQVEQPQGLFDTAILRVQEIAIGVVSAALVHTIVFPQSVMVVLADRVRGVLADANCWIADSLSGRQHPRIAAERRKFAADATEIHLMATHLPFDTANLRPRRRLLVALQDQLVRLLPLTTAVEDRLQALGGPDALPEPAALLLADAAAWAGDADRPNEEAVSLAARAARLVEALEADAAARPEGASWSDLLLMSLFTRLGEMIGTHARARALAAHVDDPGRPADETLASLPESADRQLHRDPGMALLSAMSAAAGVLVCCAFWIATAWPEGAIAAMFAGVLGSLFAGLDDPTPHQNKFFLMTLLSIPLAAFYLFAVMPHIDGFAMLALVLAPVLLPFGMLLALPAQMMTALPMFIGFLGALAIGPAYAGQFESFLNINFAQAIGVLVALVMTRLVRVVGAAGAARRLVRATDRALIAIAQRRDRTDLAGWTSRMIDTTGLLAPRLAAAGGAPDLATVDPLRDLRLGVTLLQLRMLIPIAGATLAHLLDGIARHLAGRLAPGRPQQISDPALLAMLDEAIGHVAGLASRARRDGLVALTGLRRNLFPDAPAYRAMPKGAG